MAESRYKDWDVYEVLPQGWEIDKYSGSPLYGYEFCTNGKSIVNGGKRALVRSVKKGTPRVEFIEAKFKKTRSATPEEESEYVFPARTVNTLARKKFQEQILKEIQFDLMVCEVEGWDKTEYLKELQELINAFEF